MNNVGGRGAYIVVDGRMFIIEGEIFVSYIVFESIYL